jgi:hypothetical protein
MRHHLDLRKRAGSLGSAAGVVLAAMALPAGAANLLINPGFEAPIDTNPVGGNTDGTATGWTFYGGDSLRANYYNHTPLGEWSVWEQTFQPTNGGINQNVSNITDGTTYSLSCYYYFEAAEPTIPGEVSDLALTFLNAAGNQTVGPVDGNGYSDATYIPSSSVTTTGEWIQYTVSGVAPAGAAQVQVSFDFTNGSGVPGQQGAFVDDADLEGAGIPPKIAQWAPNSDGNWNAEGNWSTGSIPNAVGGEADFYSAITSSPQTVYTDTPITAGTLHFNNANEYVVAGAPTLTLQTTTGNALVEVDQGTDELDLPVTIASNTVFNVASGATLLVANPVTINSGKSLTQTGTGTVTYQSIITVNSNGAIAFGNSTHAHELSLASGAMATVGGSVLEVDSLSNLGTINLLNNKMLINYAGGPDPITTVEQWIKNGFADGDVAGSSPAIISSSIATDDSSSGYSYGIGYADSADPGNPAGLPTGTIEIMLTLLGDANLDGIVNAIDYGIAKGNFNVGVGLYWDQGDFTYDGIENGIDMTLLAANFGQVSQAAGVLSSGPAALVPEPGMVAILLPISFGLLLNRRRRVL